jgi:hypothetical protein
MRRAMLVSCLVFAVSQGCGGGAGPSVEGVDQWQAPVDALDAEASASDEGNTSDLPVDVGTDGVIPIDIWMPDAVGTDHSTIEILQDLAVDVPQMNLPIPLCQPCRSDLECKTADVQAACLDDGPDGRTCGYPCGLDSDCPDGFNCVRDDVNGKQCRPADGESCPCLTRFVEAGFKTECYRQSELGRCVGERLCNEECPVVAPVVEECNGKDDDCNGQTDDGLGSLTCGKGACETTVQVCVASQLQECVAPGGSPEICDLIDNDCDGETDEELAPITCGVGICQVTVVACIAGRPQPCYPNSERAEECNGLDDNCDGVTDEGFGQTTCGVGECARTISNCAAGGPTQCVAGNPVDETCNGLDDNCDGVTDGGLETVTCGIGACVRTVPGCVDGVPSGIECIAGDPVTETCNGIDDNCDGITDDGIVLGEPCDGTDPDSCKSGKTICLANGTIGCDEPGQGFSESCNGQDDDCDGLTDEEGCPCPVYTFGGHMYMFCTPTANFAVARDTCAKSRYHLVKIENTTENKFIVDTAKAINNATWWIGLNDQAVEGTYVWLDGSDAAFLTWTVGAPNNGGWRGNQDCALILDIFAGYNWNDAACTDQARFVCEYP